MASQIVATNNYCKCPRCHASGRSVAALHYQETELWEKQGGFSVSAIGIGSGGIGVGVGGGSYSEEGTVATKRAQVFDEPKPASYRMGRPALVCGYRSFTLKKHRTK